MIAQTNAVRTADAADVAAAHSAWISSVAHERKLVNLREVAKADSERLAREAAVAEEDSNAKRFAYLNALEETGAIPPRK